MTNARRPSDSRPFGSGPLAVLVACLTAALLALMPRAHAEPLPNAPLAEPPPQEHGLSPFPGAAPVPQSDRPPGSRPGDGGPSPVIFPAQELPIRFNHKKHVRELGVPCTACHDQAKTSRNSRDSLLPPATRCDACHGSDHRKSEVVNAGKEPIGECAFCHAGYRPGAPVARLEIPEPNLRFNHALHVQRGMACERCHGRVENIELATADQLPRMRGCLDCHHNPTPKKGEASGACTTCHLSDRGGMLKTELPSGQLTPPAWLHDAEHGPDWLERHKRVAADESRFCANCHSERFCTGCHDGRVRPRRVHPNDWISMHPVAARENDPSCTSCHRHQSFCLDCHQRSGVTLSGPVANFASRGRFHPPKSIWTDGPRGSSHHAWEAERNLNACVSCHTERDCASCHATPGVGGGGTRPCALTPEGCPSQQPRPGPGGRDPHPAGFVDRCAHALRTNARPCLFCHDPEDPDLARCR